MTITIFGGTQVSGNMSAFALTRGAGQSILIDSVAASK
jgi:hypothetical protein